MIRKQNFKLKAQDFKRPKIHRNSLFSKTVSLRSWPSLCPYMQRNGVADKSSKAKLSLVECGTVRINHAVFRDENVGCHLSFKLLSSGKTGHSKLCEAIISRVPQSIREGTQKLDFETVFQLCSTILPNLSTNFVGIYETLRPETA